MVLVHLTLAGRSFSRSYGSSLPNSLTEVLPFPLVFSTHPPVSVCGTVAQVSLEAFLESLGSVTSTLRLAFTPQLKRSFLPALLAYRLGTGTTNGRLTYPPLSPLRSINLTQYRNINLLSIGYALRPRLRPDSPDAD